MGGGLFYHVYLYMWSIVFLCLGRVTNLPCLNCFLQLQCDLTSSLSRLLDASDHDTFWRIGWLYIRMQHRMAFIYNGVDTLFMSFCVHVFLVTSFIFQKFFGFFRFSNSSIWKIEIVSCSSVTGHVVTETLLPSKNNGYSTILSIKPIAVPASKKAQFMVKGFNLKRPSVRYSLMFFTLLTLAISFFCH